MEVKELITELECHRAVFCVLFTSCNTLAGSCMNFLIGVDWGSRQCSHQLCWMKTGGNYNTLRTHWGRDKMVDILQMTFFSHWTSCVHKYCYTSEIQNYLRPDGSLGPTDHDPYGSQSTGNGSHHWCFYLLEILICVPRTQVVSSWWVRFEF